VDAHAAVRTPYRQGVALGALRSALNRKSLYWSIETLGTDSYEIADLTVHYTYLTPKP